MATPDIDRDSAAKSSNEPSTSRSIDLKLEVVVIPVSDVDRAKAFYTRIGWRLDADFASGDAWRVIQFTPPGSACSVIFGRNVTAAAPGSARGLYLIVSDLEAARADLLDRGIDVGGPFHGAGDVHAGPDEPYLSGSVRVGGVDPKRGSSDDRGCCQRREPVAVASATGRTTMTGARWKRGSTRCRNSSPRSTASTSTSFTSVPGTRMRCR
ncbi:VOC family protein [Bradyrhizobium betae]|uniref:VOC family protein n=1 Tax=Bradyrhizobium betae TaxID=244734 RepID=UPI001FCF0206|nr:VOC family protein [Bradyrhizobium betae]MCS3726653.1 catechol 2,3-dioxygenase-like lactoylglutathione lyase family enzyme [Bradyrhizobium betae]